ncbi:zinc finger C-x8-C-x5-C-x3-H type family protein [Tasmannia lanceolata]|uniref:zinc finger C-x8-C-x5-C-x3-H type family protein n=1 Tax=Tasmannia lanceolata TaxID=3420 RepID=UPI004064C2EC
MKRTPAGYPCSVNTAKSLKLKRVSWPSDLNLCQVRLFLSEDAPSQSGLSSQDHLQAKTSWLWHSTVIDSDDNLPPGFEGPQPKAPQIPLIKWQCPRRLILNPDWLVVAGEESKEVEVQNQRELRVLEAVYPRPSAIPPSPSVSSEAHEYYLDNLHTPLIPITPAEEDDAADSFDPMPSIPTTVSSIQPSLPKSLPEMGKPPQLIDFRSQDNILSVPKPTLPSEKPTVGIVPGVEPDVVAAASAVFTAITRSNEEGSLIDPDLLINILANPKLLEQLVSAHGMPTNLLITPKPTPMPATVSTLQPPNVNIMESKSPFPAPMPGNLFPLPNTIISNPGPQQGIVQVTTNAPVVKDINYYKNLIQQHGEEKQDGPDHKQFNNYHNYHPFGANLETIQSSKQRDSRPKIPKPCLYFNSSRGCRHGSNCQFQHDLSFKNRTGSMPEGPNGKRIKMESEITGRS